MDKVCRDCNISKPVSEFSKHSSRPDGLKDRCRICDKVYQANQRKDWKRPTQRRVYFNPPMNDKKICSLCKKEKSCSDFTRNNHSEDGYEYRCKTCRKLTKLPYCRPDRPDRQMRIAANNFFARSGKTLDVTDKEKVLTAILSPVQICAICGKAETGTNQHGVKRLAIDHCHRTGKFRGLLCFNCNVGLGKFGDDPELLRRAMEYLLSSAAAENVG